MHQEPEEWGGQTQGALGDEAAKPKAKKPPRGPVWKSTRQELREVCERTRRNKARRESLTVEQYNAFDLAMAWQRRLRDHGFTTNLGAQKALAKRFADLRKAGVSNQDLDAMSEAFFDQRLGKGYHGDLWKLFIAKSSTLLADIQHPTLAKSGGYATTKNPLGPDGTPLADYLKAHQNERLAQFMEDLK